MDWRTWLKQMIAAGADPHEAEELLLSRRTFLSGAAASAAIVALPTIEIPEQRIWAVSGDLQLPDPPSVELVTQRFQVVKVGWVAGK